MTTPEQAREVLASHHKPVKMGDRDDWRVNYAIYGGPWIVECGLTDANPNVGDHIATVAKSTDINGRTRDFPELQRRCRLLSSGPMLLAALKIAADTLMAFDGGDTSTHTGWKNEELLGAWLVAQDAIHKAEGPTP